MEPIKPIAGNLVVVAVSLLLGLFLVEGALHILPTGITGVAKGFPLVPDEDVAFLHKPNISMRLESQCFSAQVSTNSLGFRDEDWNGPQDIVVLGDSYMEGAQVNDGEDFSSVLEGLTGKRVANLGVASFNPVGELELYRKFGRMLSPKVVILAFYPGNDVTGSNCANNRGPSGLLINSCGEIRGAEIVFPKDFYSVSGSHTFRSFVRENCLLCKLTNDTFASLHARNVGIADVGASIPYTPAYSTALEDSWRITEEAIRQLRDDVRADDAELIVVAVPEHIAVSPTGKEEFMEEYELHTLPEGFNVREPEARLARTLAALDIPLLSLTDSFIAYQKEHNLGAPYLSYTCDAHWNADGHRLAAEVVADFLKKENY